MILFLKGFLIGIAKIIPGVSGAMLAINFNLYEKIIDALTNFFPNWKNNLIFLLKVGLGIILAIVLCSNLISYLLNNYKFITMMFFTGLIMGGTYNFSKQLKYSSKNIFILILILLITLIITLHNPINNYILTGKFIDNIIFFIGGIIEISSSIIPGISGTALHLMLGIYDNILEMISQIFNFNYIINHINIYLSYSLGMFFSLIITLYLVNYFLKKYRETSYLIILGLSLSSILVLLLITFKTPFSILEFILGIMLLFVGLLISCILDK